MKTLLNDNVLSITFTNTELTKEELDKKTDTEIVKLFNAITERVKDLSGGNQDFKSVLFNIPYLTRDEIYHVHFDMATKKFEYKRENYEQTNEQKALEKALTSTDMIKLSQPERVKFVKNFIGKGTEIINYNKFFFNRDKQTVFISHDEVEHPKNQRIYGCMPVTIYNIETSAFNAKTTGKLWRKMDGLVLDAEGEPLLIKRFGLSEDDMKKYNSLKRWDRVLLFGSVNKDTFAGHNDMYFNVEGIITSQNNGKNDFDPEKSKYGRIELSTHTRFTQLGAETHEDEVFEQAAKLGLGGLTLTDTDSVQAYRTGMNFDGKFENVRTYYGVELDVIDNHPNFVFNPNDTVLNADDTSFVAFDIESSGLSGVHDRILQLSAVRYKKSYDVKMKGRGKTRREVKHVKYDVIDSFNTFVNSGVKVSQFISDLTHITQKDLDTAPVNEKEAIQKFYEFIEQYDNTILVGHNVGFDYHFINYRAKDYGLHPIEQEVIDTLPLARRLVKGTRSFRLGELAKKLKIKLDNAHNSLFDATATGYVLFALLQVAKFGAVTDEVEPDLKKLNEQHDKADIELNTGLDLKEFETHSDTTFKEQFPSHISLIAKNQAGIKQMYQLISDAHVKYFYKTARIYKDMVRETVNDGHNLIYGSGDANGELFDTLTRYGYDTALEVAKREQFDYLEMLSPTEMGLLNVKSDEDEFNRYKFYFDNMLKLADEINAVPVISGDVHYMNKSEKGAYNIVRGFKPGSEKAQPELELKSADDLIDELKPFTNEETAHKLVIGNTRKVVQDVSDDIVPIKSKLTPPRLPGADEELTETAWNKAHELYGKDLPELISDRIEKELKAIINNGFSVIYLTAKKLVDWSNQTQGYLVGSRGSVGGSLVAFLVGITEVNSLPPHYRSAHGDYLEFVDPIKFEDGFDLPEKDDPNHPGEKLIGDGHNCSFEIFAGVAGKKVPDIDLNFASEIQSKAQLELKNIFGEENVYRVGTIGTIADKTAYGYVKHYADENELDYSPAKVEYFKGRLSGIKRTSGEHAAGVLIVPQDKDITDFSPYTYPANKVESEWKTTMFDKNMMHDSLLKMDCLGHVDPTMLHFLKKTTGVDPLTLSQTQIEKVAEELYSDYTRIIGMPEFGSKLTRLMVKETKPHKFSQLVEISGLSHGTDVWAGNAQDLIKQGVATLSQVISTRDKILNDTMARGYPFEKAHNLVQIVKKKEKITPDIQKELDDLNLPDWYVPSLEKIQYLFPAAHAVAYTISACRIGWYKLNKPLQFFAAWLSYRQSGDIDFDTIVKNQPEQVYDILKAIRNKDNKKADEAAPTAFLIMEAMNCDTRGYGAEMKIKFIEPTLENGDADKWLPDEENQTITLPFSMLPNVTANIGEVITEYRKHHDVMSKHSEDYKEFTGTTIPKKAVAELVARGLLED